jgi:uncharacterized membrane protein YeiB
LTDQPQLLPLLLSTVINWQKEGIALRKIAIALVLLIVFATFLPMVNANDNEADRAQIKQAALDYVEGWYAGDTLRMERALHPDLAKRGVQVNPKNGRTMVNHLSKSMMVEYTRAGVGKTGEEVGGENEITIFEVHGDIATAKVVSSKSIDYLHLVKYNGEWKIINVLWIGVQGP